ncbi:MAG: baseplate J/gp47 family protein [Chloroflexi bacterium]|nr:baseplate J/gp47 family protein [Chloroflexota bacterium]
MVIPSPNLDDRNFDQLLSEAKARFTQFSQSTAEWTDLTPSDPGIILLELFAHLTETMIYRLNRVPQKVYIEFLRLLGIRLQPPAAATVVLEFTRANATGPDLIIPRGTGVAPSRSDASGEAPVFVTLDALTIPAGQAKGQIKAYHCRIIEAELAGVGTGQPGLAVTVKRPPIVAPMEDKLELVVGVEAAPAEIEARAAAVEYDGKTYRLWREVENFAAVGPDDPVYVVDRASGTIYFAPALRVEQSAADGSTALTDTPVRMAAAPIKDRQIRVWYRSGGGAEGNVAAGVLTTLKNFSGAQVGNPKPAYGGRSLETLDNALLRGPQQFRSLQRAVTAADFEFTALNSSSAVRRARAYTRAEVWSFAERGTVEVLLVPSLPPAETVTLDKLQAYQAPDILTQVQRAIDERRPLGIRCVVNWVRYKVVHVTAHVIVRREENQDSVKKRLIDRLNAAISPYSGQFGQSLRGSVIYDLVLKEPGVSYVEQLRLVVDQAPDQATFAIAPDPARPKTWYAGSGSTLFRSLNDGLGWEAVSQLPEGESIRVVQGCPSQPGLIAVASLLANQDGSRIVVSRDCGETWEMPGWSISSAVQDMAWTTRDDVPYLLLATEKGLFELDCRPGHNPVQLLVDRSIPQDKGFNSVVAYTDALGIINVAVAADGNGGVYISSDGGATSTYHPAEVPSAAVPTLKGRNIRTLAVQVQGSRAFLWAGAAAEGDIPGDGCWRWELRGTQFPPDSWNAFGARWMGGSCTGFAFQGALVYAASRRAGVLRLDSSDTSPAWQASDIIRSGLPTEQVSSTGRVNTQFQRIEAVAARPADSGLILSGGAGGVYISRDGGDTYAPARSKEIVDTVTLPGNWLFVSGPHDIQVSSENETS